MKPRNPNIKIVRGGKIIPRETHRLPAPPTVSDGDPDRPWMGKRLDADVVIWSRTGADAVGIAMRGADFGYSLDHPPTRKSSGFWRLVMAIFLASAALYFAAQAIRLYVAM